MLANSVDPDQTPHTVVPNLGLHCSPRSQKWDARLITKFNDLRKIICLRKIVSLTFQN